MQKFIKEKNVYIFIERFYKKTKLSVILLNDHCQGKTLTMVVLVHVANLGFKALRENIKQFKELSIHESFE